MTSTQQLTGIKCDNKACDEGYYTCGRCQKEINRQSWMRMTEKEKAYDRHVDPLGAYTSGYSAGASTSCSCHISPPCSYCVNGEKDV